MPLATTSSSNALATEDVGSGLIERVQRQAVAGQVLGPIITDATEFSMPVMTAQPSAAWYTENEVISESDPVIPAVSVRPARLTSLTTLSLEIVNDNTPVQNMVTDGMVFDLAAKLDQAVFSSVTSPAPKGLADLTGASEYTTTDTAWTDLDAFIEGASLVEQETGSVTAWIANPVDTAAILALKTADGSHDYVLSNDPSSPTRRSIFGVPLFSAPAVPEGTVYGVDRSRAFLVIRRNATVDVSRDSAFDRYAVQLRGSLRAAPILPHPAAVVKVSLTPAA